MTHGYQLVVNETLIQFSVETPFSVTRAAGLSTYVSTSFVHLETDIFTDSVLQNGSNSVRFGRESMRTVIFNSSLR